MASPISYDLQGQGGGVVIKASSGNVTGDFRWIQVVNDTVLDSLESSNIADASFLTLAIVLPAGLGIGGKFTSIQVTSGVVIAYYA